MDDQKTIRVDFQPIGKRVEVSSGQTLLEAAQKAGIALLSVCGGIGVCEDCKVKVVHGQVSKLTPVEEAAFTKSELESGYRLACQTKAFSDVKLDVPPDSLSSPQRLQLESQERTHDIHPLVRPNDFSLEAPLPGEDINNIENIVIRVMPGNQSGLTFTTDIHTNLAGFLKAHKYRGRALVRKSEIIGLLPYQTAIYGIAVDIGTTKIAFFLVNLETGEIKYQAGLMNPQIAYGEDVIARISFANQSSANELEMHMLLIKSLNVAIQECCAETGVEPVHIIDAVIVGNTAMHHFFAGLPVRQLGEAPYLPAVTESMYLPAVDLGINISPISQVYLPPNIAGYVGADHVSMLIDAQISYAFDTVVALDIGTNTEISLMSQGELHSCSCASGPAFEGARIEMGMRAAPGAIEKVKLINEKVEFSTIDQLPPIGICGSGILDAVAVMRKDGAIDHRGAIRKDHLRVINHNNKYRYLLTPKSNTGASREISVSRKDVNEIQLAKAAIKAGIDSLLAEAGITTHEIDRVIIAGAFGTYIDIKNSVAIGMLPNIPLERFSQIGNAAGAGARQMLLSTHVRDLAEELALKSNYLELTTYKGFLGLYTNAMGF